MSVFRFDKASTTCLACSDRNPLTCTLLHSSFPDPEKSPSSFCQKTSQHHEDATAMLHYRNVVGQTMSGACFSPDMSLGIQGKEFSYCFMRLYKMQLILLSFHEQAVEDLKLTQTKK